MKYLKSPTYLGMIEILDGKIRFKVGKVRGTTSGNNVNKLPLARSKCEELAKPTTTVGKMEPPAFGSDIR